jgi:EmrB/QacA subfamily drug resistance transporter
VSRSFAVLSLGAGVISLMQSLIGPVLPTIQHELSTTQNTATWVLTAYLLSASVCTPILGRVGDMAGKNRTLVAVLATLAVGCALAAVAPNIETLIVARVIQGAGGAVIPLSFGILRDQLPAKGLHKAVGTLSAVIAAGSGLGVVLAGPVVNALGMRWLFWIPLAVALATAVAAHYWIPTSPTRTPGRINWPATALLSAWLVALLLAVSQAPTWGWASPGVLALLILAAAGAAAWTAVELRSTTPLIDMRMLRLPAVWPTNTVALLFGAAMFATWAFLPQLIQSPTGFSASATTAGLLMLPMLVAMFLAGLASGRLPVSPRTQLAVAAALSAVANATLAVAHTERWEIAASSAILGTGIGLAFAAMTTLVVNAVPATQTGTASGTNANLRTMGGSIGAAVMSSIVTAAPGNTGYTNGFTMFAVVSLVAVGAALLVPGRNRIQPEPAPALA